jgi:ribose transport system substrate-binding protein
MRRQQMTRCAAGLLAGLALISCGKAPHEGEHYVFVATNIKLPYWQEAQAGFKDAVRQLGFGVKVDFVGPDTYSPNDEIDAFNQAVQIPGISGVLVAPADAKLFKEPIDNAIKRGIPVICMDSDCPGSRRLMFIGTDNHRAGLALGNRMAEVLKGEGTVEIITIPGQLNLDDRLHGAQEALSHYPKINIGKIFDDKGDPRKANDLVSSLIEGKVGFDGVLCLEASGGPGAAEALRRLNLEGRVPVIAMDKDPETLDFIASGGIVASIGQKPYTMAFYGLRFLDDFHHNAVHQFTDWRTAPASPLPTLLDDGTALVDKSNVAAFQAAAQAYARAPGE